MTFKMITFQKMTFLTRGTVPYHVKTGTSVMIRGNCQGSRMCTLTNKDSCSQHHINTTTTTTTTNNNNKRVHLQQDVLHTLSVLESVKILKNGKLHFYFNEKTSCRNHVTYYRIFPTKVVVLNSIRSVSAVLSRPEVSDRLPLSIQELVLDGNGFSFSAFTSRAQKQKQVLREFINRQEPDTEGFYVTIQKIMTNIINGKNVNIDVFLRPIFADNFSRLLIGETLQDDNPDKTALWDFIDFLYAMLDPRIDVPLRTLPFLRHLPGKYGRVFRSAVAARDRVARAYFDKHKDTFEEGRIRGLVDACLQIQADDIKNTGTSWLTDDYIKGIMNDTCIAGMTEMMKSIRMLILLMCHYQDIQTRVIEEINDVIGSDAKPCPEHRKQMPYTEAVLFEMLRYVSQTPLAIPHKCNQDIEVDGYLIQKDSGVFPNIWGIHHDEDVWGDPWEFRPERFLDDGGQLLPDTHTCRISLIPFSVGKRRCPGEQFAMSRIFLIFVSLVQQFQFLPPEGVDLPSADPRLYTTKYPLLHPQYTCRVVSRATKPKTNT